MHEEGLGRAPFEWQQSVCPIDHEACLRAAMKMCLVTAEGAEDPPVFKLPPLDAAMMIYAYISAIMDGVGGLALRLIGLHTTPHFDKPFLSTSVRDFWSRRWNLVGGGSLKMLVRLRCHTCQPAAGTSVRRTAALPLWCGRPPLPCMHPVLFPEGGSAYACTCMRAADRSS